MFQNPWNPSFPPWIVKSFTQLLTSTGSFHQRIRKNLRWKRPILGGSWLKLSSNLRGKDRFHGFCENVKLKFNTSLWNLSIIFCAVIDLPLKYKMLRISGFYVLYQLFWLNHTSHICSDIEDILSFFKNQWHFDVTFLPSPRSRWELSQFIYSCSCF